MPADVQDYENLVDFFFHFGYIGGMAMELIILQKKVHRLYVSEITFKCFLLATSET